MAVKYEEMEGRGMERLDDVFRDTLNKGTAHVECV
jgi:hypothetical protein